MLFLTKYVVLRPVKSRILKLTFRRGQGNFNIVFTFGSCDETDNFRVVSAGQLSLRLSMGISDEIEDATIAIDGTKISEIEATKRRFRYIIAFRQNYKSVRPKKIRYENYKSFDPQSNLKMWKLVYLIKKKVRMRDCEKRRFRSKIDDLMKKSRRNRRSYVPIETLKF